MNAEKAMRHPAVKEAYAAQVKRGDDWQKEAVKLRKRLFRAVIGHPEHHPSWSCAACRKLQQELSE